MLLSCIPVRLRLEILTFGRLRLGKNFEVGVGRAAMRGMQCCI
jgi:hypothetical protein